MAYVVVYNRTPDLPEAGAQWDIVQVSDALHAPVDQDTSRYSIINITDRTKATVGTICGRGIQRRRINFAALTQAQKDSLTNTRLLTTTWANISTRITLV